MPHPRYLAALLTAFFAAGLAYSVSTPILEASDEVRHMAVIEYLRLGRGLPVQDPQNRGFYEQEGSQPPLYYLVMAGVSTAFDISDFRARADFNPHSRLGRADTSTNWNMTLHTEAENFPWRGTTLFVHVARIIGLLFGLGTIMGTWVIARELVVALGARGRGLESAPILAAGLAALNPMFLFISASINNDTLATLLSTLSLAVTMRGLRTGLSWKSALALGACLGGAALAKSSGLALWVIAPTALGVAALLRRPAGTPIWRALGPAALAVAVAVALAGWFYVRNQALYGDATGTMMMSRIAGPRDRLPTALELIGEYEGFMRSYIGLFGAVNVPLPDAVYAAFNGLLVVAGAGLMAQAFAWRKAWRELSAAARETSTLPALMLTGAIVVALAALIRWTSLTAASQGRLLFPTLGALSALLATGILTVARGAGPQRPRQVTGALTAGFAVLAFLSPFTVIQPAYAEPERFTNPAALPASLQRAELRYGDARGPALSWIGFTAAPARVGPGEPLALTLYWQGLRSMDANYSVAIKVYAAGDVEAATIDLTPGRGMWQTRRWVPGEIVVERLALPITRSLALPTPSELRVDVTWYAFDTTTGAQTPLTTYDGAGKPTGRQRYGATGYSHAAPVTAPAARLTLRDASVAATPVITPTRSEIQIETRWYPMRDFDRNWTVFMQLVDVNGTIVAQQDGPPGGGAFPTRWWRPGDAITDRRALTPPAPLQPGIYTLRFGLYEPRDDFPRMPAFGADGAPLPDAALALPIMIP